MSFTGEDTPMDRMIKRYCNGCDDGADPLAVPYFIHKDDLLDLAPRWLEKCREIRKDTIPWNQVSSVRLFSLFFVIVSHDRFKTGGQIVLCSWDGLQSSGRICW